jgi:hypothetical protein
VVERAHHEFDVLCYMCVDIHDTMYLHKLFRAGYNCNGVRELTMWQSLRFIDVVYNRCCLQCSLHSTLIVVCIPRRMVDLTYGVYQ